jgi:hypothetical protein
MLPSCRIPVSRFGHERRGITSAGPSRGRRIHTHSGDGSSANADRGGEQTAKPNKGMRHMPDLSNMPAGSSEPVVAAHIQREGTDSNRSRRGRRLTLWPATQLARQQRQMHSRAFSFSCTFDCGGVSNDSLTKLVKANVRTVAKVQAARIFSNYAALHTHQHQERAGLIRVDKAHKK